MKNKLLSFILAICLIIPCAFSLASCKGIKTFIMHYNLNDSEASYSEEFLIEHELQKNGTYSKMLNEYYFDGVQHGSPTESDLAAPEGKVFAGWYLDKNCSAGNELSRYNFENYWKEKPNASGMTVYARWVNEGTKILIFNLVNKDADFNKAFRNKVTFLNKSPEYIITENTNLESLYNSFPKESDLVIPEEYNFGYWKIGSAELTPEIVASIKENGETVNIINAEWIKRPVINITYSLTFDNEISESTRGIVFDKDKLANSDIKFNYNSNDEHVWEITTTVYLDELDDKIEELNLDKTYFTKFNDSYTEDFENATIEKWMVLLNFVYNEETQEGYYNKVELSSENVEAMVNYLTTDGYYIKSLFLYPIVTGMNRG